VKCLRSYLLLNLKTHYEVESNNFHLVSDHFKKTVRKYLTGDKV